MVLSDTDLPEIDFAGISIYPPGSSYGPHVTTAHELVWIEEGSARVTSGDLTVQLRPGSVVVTPLGTRVRYAWDPKVTTRHGFVLFRGIPQERVNVDLPTGDVVPALLRHLVHLDVTRPDAWYEDSQQAMQVALRALAVPRTSAERVLSPVVMASLDAVRTAWPAKGPWPAVPLQELADAAVVTPEYLCRAWTRDVGMSPVAALRAVRLSRAAFLLSRSNMSVGHVATVAGYDSPFHFSRAFKAMFGVSPRAFRTERPPATEVSAGLRAVMAHL
jgi:AraC-like DNA-binding protein